MDTSQPYGRQSGIYASLATLIDQAPGIDGSTGYGTENSGQIVINFPCMPESVELARQATYSSVSAMPMPDGFHVYHHTDPLRIPLKFSLAARDDDYCGSDGPYALLAIAARLHALVMPVPNASTVNNASTAKAAKETQSSSEPAVVNFSQGATDVAGSAVTVTADNLANVFFPPACILAIVMATGLTNGRPGMGINCRGFVERVNVNFKGPWLQGAFGNKSTLRNLPSFADYEFTFVHQPGYTNNIIGLPPGYVYPTTNALDIFNRFYKEGALTNANVTYANLNGQIVTGNPLFSSGLGSSTPATASSFLLPNVNLGPNLDFSP